MGEAPRGAGPAQQARGQRWSGRVPKIWTRMPAVNKLLEGRPVAKRALSRSTSGSGAGAGLQTCDRSRGNVQAVYEFARTPSRHTSLGSDAACAYGGVDGAGGGAGGGGGSTVCFSRFFSAFLLAHSAAVSTSPSLAHSLLPCVCVALPPLPASPS
jgi:hypothetical protein